MDPEAEFMTDEQLAKLLRVDKRTTARWRVDHGGPPYLRVGPRHILYRRCDVEEWIRQRTFANRAAEATA
jgi:excisionase family DNA binding protein